MYRFFSLVFIMMLATASLFAQTPQSFKYQAVVRNSDGTPHTNKEVSMRISILSGSASGTAVYVEAHKPASTDLGLVNLEIGKGTSTTGTFTAIDWSAGTYFVKVEFDPNGGTNYTLLGTSQLLSVPYALYADKAGNTPDVSDFVTTAQLPDVSKFITAEQLPDVSNFVTAEQLPDVSNFVTAEQLPNLSDMVTADDLADFITAEQMPDVSNFVTADQLPDVSDFVTNDDMMVALAAIGVSPPETDCDIISFIDVGQMLDWEIKDSEITATYPAGADLSKVIPVISISQWASVYPPSGKPQDFSDGTKITYTVTADDRITKTTYTAYAKAIKPVTGIELDETTLSLTVDSKHTLAFSIQPADASNKNVTWESDNDDVATVDNSGTVTAVSAGTATITVTTADGGMTDECVVTVTTANVPVTGVSLNKTKLEFDAIDATETLVATVEPPNADNPSVIWETDDAAVATVTQAGLVTAKGSGTTNITVTTAEGGYTDFCEVIVNIPVTGVTLNETELNFSAIDETAQLTATVAPNDATNKNVAWESDDDAVATVDPYGLVTAKGSGTANITVTTEDGDFEDTCEVTVHIPVTNVSLNEDEITLDAINATAQLTATVAPADATNKNVTWESDDEDVATVDNNGLVTATGIGTATITVKTEEGSFKATCDVTVRIPVTGVTLDENELTLELEAIDKTAQLTATINPAGATNQNVTWKSNDEDVATVDNNGLVTATGLGTAIITVTTVDGDHTANCTINVVGWIDITVGLLKNTKIPFENDGGPVKWSSYHGVKDWNVNPVAATNGNVHQNGNRLLILSGTGWGTPQNGVTNGKMWQTVELEAGRYKFYAYAGAIHNYTTFGLVSTFIVAALGDNLPDTENLSTEALEYANYPAPESVSQWDYLAEGYIEFSLNEKTEVSLGWVTNIPTGGNYMMYVADVHPTQGPNQPAERIKLFKFGN